MEAPKAVPDPPDRNAAIATASEQQHQVNLERELEYGGLRKRVRSGLAYYATEDIYDFISDLAKPSELATTSQLELDYEQPTT